MIDLILARLRANKASVIGEHINAVRSLSVSGILEFLKARAEPSIIGQGTDVQAMATQAARSVGYNEAIRDILYFRELYIDPEKVNELPRDYGGNQIALASGLLTEEEIDAIRTGKPVNYTTISTKPLPAAGNTHS